MHGKAQLHWPPWMLQRPVLHSSDRVMGVHRGWLVVPTRDVVGRQASGQQC
jgi:hypothetical protein